MLFVVYLLLLDSQMTSGTQAIFISGLLTLTNVLLVLTIFVDTKVRSYGERGLPPSP